jgi:RNA polymerase primary sigma factor
MLKDKIEQVLKTLTYREREIIKLRYGLGDGYTQTLEEGEALENQMAREAEEKAKHEHDPANQVLRPWSATLAS